MKTVLLIFGQLFYRHWATFFFIAVICVQSLGDFLLKSTFPMVDSQFLPRVSEGCVTKVMKMFRETERTKSHI